LWTTDYLAVCLGTADTVLKKLLDKDNLYDPVELQKKVFGLPAALFEAAERIGLRDVIVEAAPEWVEAYLFRISS
jgi:hypothetical protein